MDIFGFTPVEAALAGWGLNLAYAINDFIFVKTSIGLVVFAIGFCVSLIKVSRQGSLRPFLIYAGTAITLYSLLIRPFRDIEHINSSVEVYGQNTSLSSENLRHQLSGDNNHYPAILTYCYAQLESLVITVAHLITLPLGEKLQFYQPFELQLTAVSSYEIIQRGPSGQLQTQLDNFNYMYFLPAIARLLKTSSTDINYISPDDPKLDPYVSRESKQQWGQLSSDLQQWDNAQPLQQALGYLTGIFQYNVDTAQSAMLGDICTVRAQHAFKITDWFWGAVVKVAGYIFKAWPYFLGIGSALIFIAYPLVLMVVFILGSLRWVVMYLGALMMLCMVKVASVCCYGASILFAFTQALSSTNPSWFWQKPWFAVVGGCLLIITQFLIIVGGVCLFNRKG